MKRMRCLKWLFAALMGCVSISASAQEKPADDGAGEAVAGEWIWVEGFDGLPDDAVTIAAGSKDGMWYAGGRGWLMFTLDDGENWDRVQLKALENSAAAAADNGGDDDDEIISRKKDLIRDELENHYNAEFAESIIDGLDDREILEAETTADISGLDDFSNISIDLKDAISDSELKSSIEIEEDNEDDADQGDERHDFWNSLRVMTDQGADPETAAEKLINSGIVWQIEPVRNSVYVLAPDAVYMSKAPTKSSSFKWTQVFKAQDSLHPYVFSVSNDGKKLSVGTLAGLSCSIDAGKSWNVTAGVSGVPYRIVQMPDEHHLVLTTEGVFSVSEDCAEAAAVKPPMRPGERAIDALVVSDALWIATEAGIYVNDDGSWHPMLDVPFQGQPIRQLANGKRGPVVRTETAVYELDQDKWKLQDTGIFGDFTRHLATSPRSKNTAAVMLTSQTVLVAARDKKSLPKPEMADFLKKVWAQELSESDIIFAALEAHGLGDAMDKNWKARIWTSFLLPKINVDFYRKESIKDVATRTMTLTKDYDISKYSARWDQKHETYNYWQVMALWEIKLENYEKQEFAVERLYKDLSNQRLRVIHQVRALYKRLRTKQMRIIKKKSTYKDLLEIEKLETMLHFMTGGKFVPVKS